MLRKKPPRERAIESIPEAYSETIQVPGGWANRIAGMSVAPKYPWERAFYTTEEEATEAAVRTAKAEYDIARKTKPKWGGDPRQGIMMLLLGALGAK